MSTHEISGMKISTVLVFISASCFLTGCRSQEVCIVPDSGKQELPSYCEKNISLNKFCQDAGDIRDNTVIIVLNGSHRLNTTCEVKNVSSLLLRGQNESKITINCDDSGFRFLNILSLMISDMEFTGCGATWTTTVPHNIFGLYPIILSALLFFNGSNLTLTNVTVSDAISAGIYIYNVAGNVTVDSCVVTNASSHTLGTMGGNVIVYDSLAVTSLHIANSLFNNSGYEGFKKGNCTNEDGSFSQSSGLALFLGSSKLTVDIVSTNFSHNTGCHGGNIAVLFYNHTSVTISNATFKLGIACNGGGMYVSFENSFLDKDSRSDQNYSSKVLNIDGSMFINNHAEYAGGGAFLQWMQSLIQNGSYEMELANTTFSGNSLGVKGDGGLAIHYITYLDNSDNPKTFPKFHVILNISSCTFSNHYLDAFQSESSVVLVVNAPYLGINGITVNSNNCTGVLAIESTLVFFSTTRIWNNKALTGAGIRLCSSSTIYLTPHTDLIITNNSVQQTGGGIQVNSNCFTYFTKCFYQYSRNITYNSSLLKTVNFTISNNHAPKGGDNIYGGSIDYCYLLYVKSDDKRFKNRLHVPYNTINHTSSITSDPQHICFNYSSEFNGEFECNNNRTAESITMLYPGENVTLPIRVVGQSFGSVPGTVFVSIEGNATLDEHEKVQTVGITGKNVTYTIYSVQAGYSENEHVIMNLNAGPYSDTSTHEVSNRYSPAKIKIQFKDCPFGFTNIKISSKSNISRYICQCFLLNRLIINCSILDQTITKRENSWLGEFRLDNQTFLAYSNYCPLDYCYSSFLDIKSSAHNLSQDEQCQYNRTGILCGSCPEGWSLVLGSSECREKCSNVWLLLILPFALAGLLLVVVIHFLNLTVTMGTVCGLIFYANIVQDYSIAVLSRTPYTWAHTNSSSLPVLAQP